MIVAVFVPLAVAALLVFLVVLFVQRGREGLELPTQTLFRAYLYVGSFAAVIVLAFGLAALLNAALASVVGNEFVYGGSDFPRPPIQIACPPGADCPQSNITGVLVPLQQEFDRRRAEDAVRGATFTLFGGLFWLVHWLARNRTGLGDQGALERAYILIGTAVFGVATIVLLPTGVYQALSNWLVPRPAEFFRQGVGDSLTAGIVSLVIWLIYLWQATQGLPRGRRVDTLGRGPGGPPAEPAIPPRERE